MIYSYPALQASEIISSNALLQADLSDITAPVITRIGPQTIFLTVGQIYNDLGATALDDVDGDITDDIVTDNPVNTAIPDTYVVRYNVSDSALNPAAEVTRSVVVSLDKPNPFDLGGAVINVAPGSVQRADPFIVAGATPDTDLVIDVTNGTYSVNGSIPTSDPGLVTNGDIVQFYVVAASTQFTPIIGSVNIQGTESDFIVVTRKIVLPLPGINFDLGGATTNAKLDSVQQATPFILSGAPGGDVPITVTNGIYSIDDGPQTAVPGVVQNGQRVEFWVTAESTPNTVAVGNLNIDGVDRDFIVVTGPVIETNSGIAFYVRDPDTNDLIIDTTIDLIVSTEEVNGTPLYELDGLAIDSTGLLVVPLNGGELGRQVFVYGVLASLKIISGNAVIMDITDL